jgi:hypothetical protein
MLEQVITGDFLKALDRYLAGEINAREAAKESMLGGPNKFLEIIKEAYKQNFIVIRAPIDQQLCDKFRQWAGLACKLEPYIIKGKPDDKTFALQTAETFLIYLRRLLLNSHIEEINIGIISGSSTGSLVDQLTSSGLWDEIIPAEEMDRIDNKTIKIIALNANPVEGWELQGDANISTLHLAMLLKTKLCGQNKKNVVTPHGISSASQVTYYEESSHEQGSMDRKILEITDPKRLGNSKPNARSKINIIITGIGSRKDSIFSQIMEAENIAIPSDTVGDVAYSPVDKNGKSLPLKKGNKSCSVCSAIRLETMRQLVENGAVVMLVARNSRRGNPVDKSEAIRAAIRGKYINVICTDEVTAQEIIKDSAEPQNAYEG